MIAVSVVGVKVKPWGARTSPTTLTAQPESGDAEERLWQGSNKRAEQKLY